MRPAIRKLLAIKRSETPIEKAPRKLYERREITEAEGDELLAKHAPYWLEHLYWDDEVLNRVLYQIARAGNGKRPTSQS